MGLDMFFYRKEKGTANRDASEIGYLRKANMIHGWLNNHEIGIKDCEYYVITHDVLIELKKDINTVLANSEVNSEEMIVNPSTAKELIPTCEGFFFGSLQYSQMYIDDLKDTLEIVNDALIGTDFDKEEVLYYAWW